MNARRIHITGGPGAGKSWLAQRLSRRLGLPYHDLDGIALELQKDMPGPLDFEALMARRLPLSQRLAAGDAWISDGSNLEACRPFHDRAELIIYLTVPWRVAAYRIVARHAKRSLAGNNRFPGLRRLYRFWRWCGRYYANRNPHGVNGFGTPETIAFHEEALQAYADKLVMCRTKAEVEAVEARLTAALPAR
jgi:adenylate kinase family enzyme